MLAEHEHVLHRMRDQIGRRLRRAGKLRGVVPLIRMNDAAKSFAISHENGPMVAGSLRVQLYPHARIGTHSRSTTRAAITQKCSLEDPAAGEQASSGGEDRQAGQIP